MNCINQTNINNLKIDKMKTISKDLVKSKLPKARSERQRTNGGQVYWLIRNNFEFMYISEGKTEKEAWNNAAIKLGLLEKKQ